ncbi:MAG: hypothetical protein R3195_12205 [Gemmatimonadota bacterium]|nr:hypothetical protein [Gemmatimonadota bacterium]
MTVFTKYGVVWIGGTAIIYGLARLTGGGPGAWLAGAAMIAAFPAGVAASRDAVRWRGPRFGPLVAFAGLTLATAVVVFALDGWVEPMLTSSSWPFGDRLAAVGTAFESAEQVGTLEAWRAANRLAWTIDVAVSQALTAGAVAWVGALLGAWLPAEWSPRVRFASFGGAGLFLLVTVYLMAENGYELLLMQTLGPAQVTAWLPLIAPGMIAVGLAIPTILRLVEPRAEDAVG